MSGLLRMTLSGGVLILLITAVRAVALHRLPKAVFPALWMTAALRLLLPVKLRIPIPVPVPAAVPSPGEREAAAWTAGTQAVYEGPAALSSFAPLSLDWGVVWTAVWLAGAVLAAAYFVRLYLRAMGRFRTSLPVEAPVLREWLGAQRLRRPLDLRQSDRIDAPLTYGILRPVILLPKGMERRDPGTLRYVLTHELVHVRRFDGGAKLVFAAALCVHWFNPLAWLLYFLAGRDLELSCDEQVLRILGGEARTGYALSLISMEEERIPDLSFCSHFSRLAIEERIEAIMKYKKKSVWAAVLAVVLVLGSVTAFATAVPMEKVSDTGLVESEVLSRGGGNGEKLYSVDGGETWLGEEEYQARYGSWGEDWKVEWWTAEEYARWLEQEKKDLQDIIGSKGWTPSTGWFTWDQKKVDETVDQYEEILEKIKGGALYSKTVLDRDGRELQDVALGSDAPLDAVMITTAEGSTDLASVDAVVLDPPVDGAKLLKELEPFGVTGSEKSGLTYKGRPVRTLVDGAAIEGGYSVQYLYRNDTGTVDLHTLRVRKDNGDGSYDPMGALTGVAARGERGFDQDLMDSCRMAGSVTAEATVDSAEPQNRPISPISQDAEASVAMGSETDEGTPLLGMFDKYKPFGLEYRETRTAEGMERNLFYQGEPVNHFADIDPAGGVFTFGSSTQAEKGLTVRALYGEDGTLTGLTAGSPEN